MTDQGETIRALAQITDPGLFERLAAAVLRQTDPTLYGNLTHPGMNAEGKTVKSPVDGIAFVRGANPPHMVITHHASGVGDDLKKKWLHNPLTVMPRRGPKPSTPSGDVIKTMSIVEEERKRTPELHVTLALTTNREPSEDLTRDVAAAAINHGITIDIWSGSRIAHHLDNDPDGQWLRKSFLSIEQQRLSKQLLREISSASLKTLNLMARAESLVDRELDRVVADRSPRPVAFLVGESGLGKTIACYKHLKAHVDAGGCGLVITQEVLAAHRTLDQALDTELRKLHSSMESDAGAKARALCSPDDPLLILVEDLNWSDRPALLLERLVGWAQTRSTATSGERSDWHLFCPVWPKILAMTSEEARKRIDTLSVSASPFTSDEARAAIQRSAALAKVPVSSLEADNLAGALGNDPLLIALYDFARKPDPRQVIGVFVNNGLCRLANNPGNFTLTDYREALKALARKMLLQRRVDPTWTEVQEWLRGQPDHLSAMRQITHHGEVVRLTNAGQGERVAFRHDRVRAWLLSDGVADLMQIGQLDDAVLFEPFFADVIGTALVDPNVPEATVARVGASNPLALFYALKVFREPSADVHHAVLRAVDTWLGTEETCGRASRNLRWAALQVLSETESSHVLAITCRFRDQTWFSLFARFRNGDVWAGIKLCLWLEPGVTAPWRDRQIAHAKVRFGTALTHRLDELLKLPGLSGSARTGGLRLAGHLADPAVADAIAACWASDPNKTERLADYLWAAAECCGNDPGRLLEPVCDAWAALSDEAPQDGSSSPRSALAADHISWAFREALPSPALRYFIDRAQQDDLHWPITYMLRGIDHPDAVEFISHEFAAYSRASEGTDRFWLFPSTVGSDWESRQAEKGIGMSLASRQRLRKLWASTDNDKHLRRQAFLLWAATSAPDDVDQLQTAEDSSPLADDILRARLKRGDRAAIPALLGKIKTDEQGYWWQLGRSIWSDDLTNALEEALERRGTTVERVWGADCPTDWITSKLLMRLKPAVVERMMVKHWDHLRHSLYFIQAALYVATPITNALVREAMSQCPDAGEMLKFIDQHFGIKRVGHPGVSHIEQVEALVPYLDYLSPRAIYTFWDLCNERGWLDFRRTHFDARLEGRWRELAQLDDSRCFTDLDEQCAEDRIHWIDHWIDRYLKQGEQLDQIFCLLGMWLRERRTISALELVAAAIVHAGGHRHLDLLCVDGIEPVHQAEEIVSDTRFSVSRRSLV